MCTLLVDVQVETGAVTGNPDDPTPVTCDTGRVVLAATAHTGILGSTNAPVPVGLDDGALTDTVQIAACPAVTVHYYLTTARVAEL